MSIVDAVQANLLSPAVLFFVLGLIAALSRSDLKFPEPLYAGLTIYLLVAISSAMDFLRVSPAIQRLGRALSRGPCFGEKRTSVYAGPWPSA